MLHRSVRDKTATSIGRVDGVRVLTTDTYRTYLTYLRGYLRFALCNVRTKEQKPRQSLPNVLTATP